MGLLWCGSGRSHDFVFKENSTDRPKPLLVYTNAPIVNSGTVVMNFYFWLVLLLQFVYAHACPSIQRCPFFESDHSALPKNAAFLLKHAIKKVKN